MIRRLCILAATAAALAVSPLASAWAAQGAAGPPPTPEQLPTLNKVKDNIYVAMNRKMDVSEIGPFGGNATIVVTPDGVLMIDSKTDAMHDDLVAKVKSITPLPIKYLVLTHNHADHAGGSARMQAMGVTVISSEADRQNMARANQSGQAQVTYSHSADVHLGGQTFQLREFRGHTRGDTVVYMPQAKVIVVGDLVTTPDTIPGIVNYGDGGNWSDWCDSLDEIAKMDFDTLIGGHGPVLTKAQFIAFRDKIEAIRDRFRALNRQRKTPEEITQTLLQEFNWGAGPAAGNVAGMVQELR